MSKEPPPNLEINKEASELIKKQTEEFLTKKPGNKIEKVPKPTREQVLANAKKNARHDGVSPEKQTEIDRKVEFNRRQEINKNARRWNRNDVKDK